MEQDIQKRPTTGVGVMIWKDGKVLLTKRKGSHGAGEYAFPGGHLEYMESVEDCARRETKEECDLEIKNIRFQFSANVRKYVPKHYIHIGVMADWASGEAKTMEPTKAEEWKWYDVNNPPKPLLEMCELAFIDLKEKKGFYDN